jgi:hypothetical protein
LPLSQLSAGLSQCTKKLYNDMKNLKIIYTEIHRYKKTFINEIDVNSQEQLTALLEKVRARIDDHADIEDLPVEPSKKLEDWLDLYFYLNSEDYFQKIDVSGEIENPLDCERVWSIQNQDGEIYIEDRWSM